MKVVINRCYGGFGLSEEAQELLEHQGRDNEDYGIPQGQPYYAYRAHPSLIRVVEQLGDLANSDFADLKIVEIPDGIKWGIRDSGGKEHIYEEHRTWS